MKKFLSCVLAMALVLSLMSTTVFAAENVVGTFGGGVIDDGKTIDQFGEGKTSAEIKVNFNGNKDSDSDGDDDTTDPESTIENRYAVDITYVELVIDLTNIDDKVVDTTTSQVVPNVAVKYVWNVNTHRYEKQYFEGNSDTPMDPTATKTFEPSNDPVVIKDSFQITNHSDLAIWYIPTLSPNAKAVQMTMYLYDTEDTATDDNGVEQIVEKATAGVDGAVGTATNGVMHEIYTSPTANWVETINALSRATATNGDVIGQVLIKITPYKTQP